LAACSKNFADLFETPSLATGSVCVILEATSAENMAALLEFMYKGEVHVSQKALESFLKAAESLQVCFVQNCLGSVWFQSNWSIPTRFLKIWSGSRLFRFQTVLLEPVQNQSFPGSDSLSYQILNNFFSPKFR
jgi:BTB/POZ domain